MTEIQKEEICVWIKIDPKKEKKYDCPYCRKFFRSISGRNSHISRNHGIKTLFCKGFSFNYIEKENTFECPICKIRISKESVPKHIKRLIKFGYCPNKHRKFLFLNQYLNQIGYRIFDLKVIEFLDENFPRKSILKELNNIENNTIKNRI